MERRRFLQLSLGGSAILAIGGLGLGLQRTRLRPESPELRILNAREYAILWAIAERICPGRKGLPSAGELGVSEKIDGLFSRMESADQRDFKLALGLFENALAGLVLERRLRPFTQLNPAEQDEALACWRDSSIETARIVYRSIRDLVAGTYWGDPGCFATVGYPGPPALGG